jgi:hypothetical protein
MSVEGLGEQNDVGKNFGSVFCGARTKFGVNFEKGVDKFSKLDHKTQLGDRK